MPRPAVKKDAIERSALELFVEKGIDGTSIRDIARRAGVTEGALYRHHASKNDLVRALFFHYFENYAELLRHAAEGAGTMESKLGAMIEGFYTEYDRDPKSFLFVMNVRHVLLEDVRRDMANPTDVLLDVLRDAITSGEIPEQDAILTTHLLMGMVMHAAVGHRYGRIKGKLRAQSSPVTRACMAVLKNS
ncbi:MAG: TetR/AcrR family transcriptional regulator [Sumerlaeia bacterium]